MSGQTNENILPGLKPVAELLKQHPERIIRVYCRENRHGPEWQSIFALCERHNIPVEIVSPQFLTDLCDMGSRRVSNQGIAAEIVPRAHPNLDSFLHEITKAPLPLAIALDQVRDPANLGAIARTALALGCAGIITPRHNGCGIGAGARRAAAGALEQLPLVQVTNLARALDSAEEQGLTIYGATASAGNCPDKDTRVMHVNAFDHSWRLPAILTLGGENRGLRPGVAKRCGIFITIPFARPFESLNVAQAGAILTGLCAARFFSSS